MLRWLACVALAGTVAPVHGASPRIVLDGFENPCQVDADTDRLPNCSETALLTDPFDPDTDSDGLSDGDEVLGSPFGLDLPAFGVSPRRRDLLLEVDWVNDNTGCAFHTHRPSAETFADVQTVFAAIPLVNPDGSSGINVIIDYGQSSLLSGGNQVNDADGTVKLEDLQVVYEPAHFAANRRGYFRYSIHAHSLGESKAYSGVADGDANLVTLGCQADTPGYVRSVIVHELGHNLGLLHGGGDACLDKPNYNSVMNYRFLFPGLDIDCDRFPDGIDHIGFSQGTRRLLDKSALIEADGVCAAGHPLAKPVDWNGNGVIDVQPVAVDFACAWKTVLEDWDDVGKLRLSLYTSPNGGPPPPSAISDRCPVPPQPGGPP